MARSSTVIGTPASAGRRRRRGMTLVEILVVVTCLGIAAALVLPSLGNPGATQLRSAAESLVADLQYAQQFSLAHGDDPCMIVFDPVNESFGLARASNPASIITHPVDKMPYYSKFGAGRLAHLRSVSIDKVDMGADNRFAFRSLGQLDQLTPVKITLRAGKDKVDITLDPETGEATVGNLHR
jgi:prepilin-type N-terminal cleavage/methylation domain-containing protein